MQDSEIINNKLQVIEFHGSEKMCDDKFQMIKNKYDDYVIISKDQKEKAETYMKDFNKRNLQTKYEMLANLEELIREIDREKEQEGEIRDLGGYGGCEI